MENEKRMTVRILQLDIADERCFMAYQTGAFSKVGYKYVHEERIEESKSLGDIFQMYNFPREGYTARSLSVSDLVEIEKDGQPVETFFCNTIGWKQIL